MPPTPQTEDRTMTRNECFTSLLGSMDTDIETLTTRLSELRATRDRLVEAWQSENYSPAPPDDAPRTKTDCILACVNGQPVTVSAVADTTGIDRNTVSAILWQKAASGVLERIGRGLYQRPQGVQVI